jgi:hypothetical protein
MAPPPTDALRAQARRIREMIGDLAHMARSPGSDVIVGEIEGELATLLESVGGDPLGFLDRRPPARDR